MAPRCAALLVCRALQNASASLGGMQLPGRMGCVPACWQQPQLALLTFAQMTLGARRAMCSSTAVWSQTVTDAQSKAQAQEGSPTADAGAEHAGPTQVAAAAAGGRGQPASPSGQQQQQWRRQRQQQQQKQHGRAAPDTPSALTSADALQRSLSSLLRQGCWPPPPGTLAAILTPDACQAAAAAAAAAGSSELQDKLRKLLRTLSASPASSSDTYAALLAADAAGLLRPTASRARTAAKEAAAAQLLSQTEQLLSQQPAATAATAAAAAAAAAAADVLWLATASAMPMPERHLASLLQQLAQVEEACTPAALTGALTAMAMFVQRRRNHTAAAASSSRAALSDQQQQQQQQSGRPVTLPQQVSGPLTTLTLRTARAACEAVNSGSAAAGALLLRQALVADAALPVAVGLPQDELACLVRVFAPHAALLGGRTCLGLLHRAQLTGAAVGLEHAAPLIHAALCDLPGKSGSSSSSRTRPVQLANLMHACEVYGVPVSRDDARRIVDDILAQLPLCSSRQVTRTLRTTAWSGLRLQPHELEALLQRGVSASDTEPAAVTAMLRAVSVMGASLPTQLVERLVQAYLNMRQQQSPTGTTAAAAGAGAAAGAAGAGATAALKRPSHLAAHHRPRVAAAVVGGGGDAAAAMTEARLAAGLIKALNCLQVSLPRPLLQQLLAQVVPAAASGADARLLADLLLSLSRMRVSLPPAQMSELLSAAQDTLVRAVAAQQQGGAALQNVNSRGSSRSSSSSSSSRSSSSSSRRASHYLPAEVLSDLSKALAFHGQRLDNDVITPLCSALLESPHQPAPRDIASLVSALGSMGVTPPPALVAGLLSTFVAATCRSHHHHNHHHHNHHHQGTTAPAAEHNSSSSKLRGAAAAERAADIGNFLWGITCMGFEPPPEQLSALLEQMLAAQSSCGGGSSVYPLVQGLWALVEAGSDAKQSHHHHQQQQQLQQQSSPADVIPKLLSAVLHYHEQLQQQQQQQARAPGAARCSSTDGGSKVSRSNTKSSRSSSSSRDGTNLGGGSGSAADSQSPALLLAPVPDDAPASAHWMVSIAAWAAAMLDARHCQDLVVQLCRQLAAPDVWATLRDSELHQLAMVHLWLCGHAWRTDAGLATALSGEQLEQARVTCKRQMAKIQAAMAAQEGGGGVGSGSGSSGGSNKAGGGAAAATGGLQGPSRAQRTLQRILASMPGIASVVLEATTDDGLIGMDMLATTQSGARFVVEFDGPYHYSYTLRPPPPGGEQQRQRHHRTGDHTSPHNQHGGGDARPPNPRPEQRWGGIDAVMHSGALLRTHATEFRDRAFAARGYSVVAVPFFEWLALWRRGREAAQRDYLRTSIAAATQGAVVLPRSPLPAAAAGQDGSVSSQ